MNIKREVAAYGLCYRNTLHVYDLFIPKQEGAMAEVDMDPNDLAQFQGDLIARGGHPRDALRVWLHTHPMESPQPSGTDMATWRETFSSYDYAVMGIMGNTGKVYFRIATGLGDMRTEVELNYPDLEDFLCYSDPCEFNALELKALVEQKSQPKRYTCSVLPKSTSTTEDKTWEAYQKKAAEKEKEQAWRDMRRIRRHHHAGLLAEGDYNGDFYDWEESRSETLLLGEEMRAEARELGICLDTIRLATDPEDTAWGMTGLNGDQPKLVEIPGHGYMVVPTETDKELLERI